MSAFQGLAYCSGEELAVPSPPCIEYLINKLRKILETITSGLLFIVVIAQIIFRLRTEWQPGLWIVVSILMALSLLCTSSFIFSQHFLLLVPRRAASLLSLKSFLWLLFSSISVPSCQPSTQTFWLIQWKNHDIDQRVICTVSDADAGFVCAKLHIEIFRVQT